MQQAVEDWKHDIYSMATGALHRAISLRAATIDAPSYGVISATASKLSRMDAALGESMQKVPLTMAGERFRLPRLVVPGWEGDAHVSPKGPLITAARQVTFPESGPTWLLTRVPSRPISTVVGRPLPPSARARSLCGSDTTLSRHVLKGNRGKEAEMVFWIANNVKNREQGKPRRKKRDKREKTGERERAK